MANLARNPKFYENIAKEARKVALKYSIKKIGTFNLIFHSDLFLTGIYKGWKYYNDYKNRDVISFARHVYKKHGVFSWW